MMVCLRDDEHSRRRRLYVERVNIAVVLAAKIDDECHQCKKIDREADTTVKDDEEAAAGAP
jgi:hypothetical protein